MNLKKLNKNLHAKYFGGALLILAFFCVIFLPKSTLAYSSGQIIPDEVFRASGTMSEAQIQAFLVSKGSSLANYTIPPSQYKTYYIGSTPVTSYVNTWIGPIGAEVDATGWPVSRVIYRASQWYNVNPQVLIAVLQKESSMITDPTIRTAPDKYARMAWIMGYAYTESGITNACKTNTNHNPTGSCAGVAMQIDWAAGGFDYWYKLSQARTLTCNGGQACWPGRTVTIDGASVYIGNNITGPFYRYTPHLSWGGTFTWCMQNWFPYSSILPSVTSSLGFSNLNPANGESLSAGFALKNNSNASITIDVGLADYVIDSGRWNSYPSQNNITLAAGETRYFTFSKTVHYPGRHKSWIAIAYNGTWHAPLPQSNQLTEYTYYVHPANIVYDAFWFSTLPPKLGQPLTIGVKIRNLEYHSINVKDIAIPCYNYTKKTWCTLTHPGSITIPARRTSGTLTFTKTFGSTGYYRISPAYMIDSLWMPGKTWGNQELYWQNWITW